MIKSTKYGLLAAVVACTLALPACSKKEEPEPIPKAAADILSFIPADTPYAFATLEPTPEKLMNKLEPHIDAMLEAYTVVLRETLATQSSERQEDSAKRETFESASAALEELMTYMSVDGMERAGIDRESRFALYGNGLLPVARIKLTDGELFEQMIASVEQKAGHSMAVAKVGGQDYRYFEADEVKVILGVFGEYAVATVVPAVFDDAQLGRALGLEPPSTSLADSGELGQIAKEFSYTNHMLGFIDAERIAGTFLEPAGLNADLLALAEFDAASISDVCREEIREMATIMPRLVAGYTAIDEERLDFSMIANLREDIAAGLARLPAAVPGMGADHGGLFSFGMSLNVLAAREFYEARLDAMEADPFECEYFADLQNGIAAGRQALNQPVPPMVYDIRGFVAVVDDIQGLDMNSRQPPEDIDASFLIAMENAPALLQLGAMFSPELAALNLKPDGKPVEFSPQQLGDRFESSFVAMNDSAFAMSVGSKAEDEVGRLLQADSAEPAPFMSMSMDAARYYSFIGDAMMLDDDDDSDELSPEAAKALSDMMQTIGAVYDRMLVDVKFTERGVEVSSSVTLGE